MSGDAQKNGPGAEAPRPVQGGVDEQESINYRLAPITKSHFASATNSIDVSDREMRESPRQSRCFAVLRYLLFDDFTRYRRLRLVEAQREDENEERHERMPGAKHLI